MRFLSRPSRLTRAGLGTLLAAGLVAGGVVSAPLTASAAGSKHYVNCSAKAAGDGTEAKPWNSIAQLRQDENGKARVFEPGDQILFKRATTCVGQVDLQGSGVKGNPIVLGAYPSKGARPTINGNGTYNNTGTVQIINQQYWTIQDLHITNKTKEANPKTYRSGILLLSTGGSRLAGMTVQRVAVDNVRSNPGNGNTRQYGGISALSFNAGSGFDGLQIKNNSVKNVSRTGIITSNNDYPRSYDRNVLISGNKVSQTRGDGIVLIGAKNSRIAYNKVSGAADLGTCGHCGRYGGPSTASAGIWPANARYIRVDHNEVWKSHAAGGDGEGFDIDRSARNVTLEYNYAHDNEGGGVLLTGARDSIIRFNILENNKMGALTFYGKAKSYNTSFYNNTVYLSKSSKAKVVRTFGDTKGSKVSFKNNLVYSYGAGQYQWPKTSISTAANTLIGTHGTGRPRDGKTSYANPGLKNPGSGGTGFSTLKGYKPKSPKSFKTGVAIPKSVTTDFFGKKINPKKPPRGAVG